MGNFCAWMMMQLAALRAFVKSCRAVRREQRLAYALLASLAIAAPFAGMVEVSEAQESPAESAATDGVATDSPPTDSAATDGPATAGGAADGSATDSASTDGSTADGSATDDSDGELLPVRYGMTRASGSLFVAMSRMLNAIVSGDVDMVVYLADPSGVTVDGRRLKGASLRRWLQSASPYDLFSYVPNTPNEDGELEPVTLADLGACTEVDGKIGALVAGCGGDFLRISYWRLGKDGVWRWFKVESECLRGPGDD